MNIEQLIKQYKTYDELRIYCESQLKQLQNLTKKIKELEEQNRLLEQNKSNVVPISSQTIVLAGDNSIGQNDAKIIAQIQLQRLKNAAMDRDLTMEESKKLDIFNKVVNYQQPDKSKDIPVDAKDVSADDLLSLIEDKSGTK